MSASLTRAPHGLWCGGGPSDRVANLADSWCCPCLPVIFRAEHDRLTSQRACPIVLLDRIEQSHNKAVPSIQKWLSVALFLIVHGNFVSASAVWLCWWSSASANALHDFAPGTRVNDHWIHYEMAGIPENKQHLILSTKRSTALQLCLQRMPNKWSVTTMSQSVSLYNIGSSRVIEWWSRHDAWSESPDDAVLSDFFTSRYRTNNANNRYVLQMTLISFRAAYKILFKLLPNVVVDYRPHFTYRTRIARY